MLNDKKRLEDSNHLQSELDNPISIEEIDKAIKKLKNKKAAGLDGIGNEWLKQAQVLQNIRLRNFLIWFYNLEHFPHHGVSE